MLRKGNSVQISQKTDDLWLVSNKKNGKKASIVAINEFNPINLLDVHYSVEIKGEPVESKIEHFQRAKAIAHLNVI